MNWLLVRAKAGKRPIFSAVKHRQLGTCSLIVVWPDLSGRKFLPLWVRMLGRILNPSNKNENLNCVYAAMLLFFGLFGN